MDIHTHPQAEVQRCRPFRCSFFLCPGVSQKGTEKPLLFSWILVHLQYPAAYFSGIAVAYRRARLTFFTLKIFRL